MTLVIADTGPLHYLVLIDAVDVLPQLYGRVMIPAAVRDELTHTNSPAAAKRWIGDLPQWCEIRSAASVPVAAGLGPGEAEAIALAQEVGADLILLDDRAARAEALRRGLLIAGTIGVLADAANHDLIDLPKAFECLSRTTFYVDPKLLDGLLAQDSQRKARRGTKPKDTES